MPMSKVPVVWAAGARTVRRDHPAAAEAAQARLPAVTTARCYGRPGRASRAPAFTCRASAPKTPAIAAAVAAVGAAPSAISRSTARRRSIRSASRALAASASTAAAALSTGTPLATRSARTASGTVMVWRRDRRSWASTAGPAPARSAAAPASSSGGVAPAPSTARARPRSAARRWTALAMSVPGAPLVAPSSARWTSGSVGRPAARAESITPATRGRAVAARRARPRPQGIAASRATHGDDRARRAELVVARVRRRGIGEPAGAVDEEGVAIAPGRQRQHRGPDGTAARGRSHRGARGVPIVEIADERHAGRARRDHDELKLPGRGFRWRWACSPAGQCPNEGREPRCRRQSAEGRDGELPRPDEPAPRDYRGARPPAGLAVRDLLHHASVERRIDLHGAAQVAHDPVDRVLSIFKHVPPHGK